MKIENFTENGQKYRIGSEKSEISVESLYQEHLEKGWREGLRYKINGVNYFLVYRPS